MAFSGSFPAKTIDLGAIALAYTVEVTDVFRGADYIEKTPMKSLRDSSVTVDWYSKTASFHRDLYEIGIPCDYVSKTPLKRVADAGVSSDYVRKDVLKSAKDVGKSVDWFEKVSAFVRIMIDSSVATDYFEKTVSFIRAFTDAGKGVDWFAKTAVFYRDLYEVGKSYDFLAKDVSRSFFDWAVGEHIPKTLFGKMFRETVGSVDYMCKDLMKRFAEPVVVRDAPYRIITLVLRDMVFGEHIPVRGFVKEIAEPPLSVIELKFMKEIAKPFAESIGVVEVFRKEITKMFMERVFGEHVPVKGITKKIVEPPLSIIELKFMKELIKPFVEVVSVIEVFRKELAKMFVERVFQEYWTSKGISPALRDIGEMKDLLTKIAYKIAGLDVRRVYALPREWADIIEDTDHNVKIEIAKCLLESMKRIKEKLG